MTEFKRVSAGAKKVFKSLHPSTNQGLKKGIKTEQKVMSLNLRELQKNEYISIFVFQYKYLFC